MPIFIQWKWQEHTQTFLLIIHFDADGSKPNLRKREMFFSPNNGAPLRLCFPFDWVYKDEKCSTYMKRSVTTWAPTHVEIGLLSELLAYANIINGLKPWKREELKSGLDVLSIGIDMANNFMKRIKEAGSTEALKELEQVPNGIEEEPIKRFVKSCGNKAYFFGAETNYKSGEIESLFGFELSQEYIEYLKKLLKPYEK
jgi:hypothetical protein